MNETTRNEDGMVYRGRSDRIHIADGRRAETGDALANALTERMRLQSHRRGEEVFAEGGRFLPLCPGCYMTALVNMAVALAKENGQSLTELGNTLSAEFAKIAAGGPERIESVEVIRD